VIETQTRTRTYSWNDPALNSTDVGRSDGLTFLRSLKAGERPAPPIMHTLGMERVDAEPGQVTVVMRAQEYHYNPLGSVHGGVIATMLDTAAGCAVHTTLPAGWGYTSLDLSTRFLRPVTVDSGELRAEGIVVNRGRTTALAEARLFDEAGRLVAHATSTCLLFEVPA
jgi:uncharacterized protein (TIGR00369 family)